MNDFTTNPLPLIVAVVILFGAVAFAVFLVWTIVSRQLKIAAHGSVGGMLMEGETRPVGEVAADLIGGVIQPSLRIVTVHSQSTDVGVEFHLHTPTQSIFAVRLTPDEAIQLANYLEVGSREPPTDASQAHMPGWTVYETTCFEARVTREHGSVVKTRDGVRHKFHVVSLANANAPVGLGLRNTKTMLFDRVTGLRLTRENAAQASGFLHAAATSAVAL